MKNEENRKIQRYAGAALAVVFLSIGFYFLIYRSDSFSSAVKSFISIINPFIYGAVIAYLCTPMCRFFERILCRLNKKHTAKGDNLVRAFSIVITVLVVLIVLTALIMLVMPQLGRSITGIVSSLPTEIAAANEKLHNFLQKYPDAQNYWDDISSKSLDKIESWLEEDLFPTAQILIGGVGTQVINVVNFVKNLFIGVIAAVYLMWSRRTLLIQAKMLVNAALPEKWARIVFDEVSYADRMFSGFLVGKIVDSAIMGVICFICTNIIGLSFAMLISVIVGVTNIIPFFGPIIGAVPCLVILLLDNPIQCVYFLIFILVLQQVDGQIIGPKILGKSTGISGLWVLFSIILFGGLYGFVGMVVGVPLFAVIYDIARKLVHYGLRRRGKEAVSVTSDH